MTKVNFYKASESVCLLGVAFFRVPATEAQASDNQLFASVHDIVKSWFSLILCICLGGCCAGLPENLSRVPEWDLKCGMTVEEVSQISGRDIVPTDAQKDVEPWVTHRIRDEQTEFWLGFPDGKLRWTQAVWKMKGGKLVVEQRRDVCLQTGDPYFDASAPICGP